MAGRHVFFSFHYDLDVWRATVVRNTGIVDSRARAGWTDSSLWEEAQRKGTREIQRLIGDGLRGTSVTAVLIGAQTSTRPWVAYEIEHSINRGNGLFGIFIDRIKDQNRRRSGRGEVPAALKNGNYPVYVWNRDKFRSQVERAALNADKPCLPHGHKQCPRCRFRNWWNL